jgi:hypothetical protein
MTEMKKTTQICHDPAKLKNPNRAHLPLVGENLRGHFKAKCCARGATLFLFLVLIGIIIPVGRCLTLLLVLILIVIPVGRCLTLLLVLILIVIPVGRCFALLLVLTWVVIPVGRSIALLLVLIWVVIPVRRSLTLLDSWKNLKPNVAFLCLVLLGNYEVRNCIVKIALIEQIYDISGKNNCIFWRRKWQQNFLSQLTIIVPVWCRLCGTFMHIQGTCLIGQWNSLIEWNVYLTRPGLMKQMAREQLPRERGEETSSW